MFKLPHNCTHLTRYLKKEMATHSGEPGGLPSLGLHRVRHDGSNLVAAAAHAIKVMLKILQARLQQYANHEQMFKLVLEKGEEPEIKLPTSVGS